MNFSPRCLGCCSFYGCGSDVVDSLMIITPIVGFHSSFAIILMREREREREIETEREKGRELVVLLCLSSWCLL